MIKLWKVYANQSNRQKEKFEVIMLEKIDSTRRADFKHLPDLKMYTHYPTDTRLQQHMLVLCQVYNFLHHQMKYPLFMCD